MNEVVITLAQIKDCHTCVDIGLTLLEAHGGAKADLDKPFPVSSILDSNGLNDTLLVLRCLPEHEYLWRMFAWWSAKQVVSNTEDERVSRCLNVVRRYAEGMATVEELAKAEAEAQAAAKLATEAVAKAVAESASRSTAGLVVWSAARPEAEAAAQAAAEAAAWSASESAAGLVVWPASKSAAWSAAGLVVWPASKSAAWSAVKLAAWEASKSEVAWTEDKSKAAEQAAELAQEIKLRSILDSGTWED